MQLDLDAIRALLDIHMGAGSSKAALHAHILAYEHLIPALLSEVDRLTAELAAAKAGKAVEWHKMLAGRTTEITTWTYDAGVASLRVAEKQWRTRSFPGWKGEKPGWAVVFGRTYVAASGPETGEDGKLACFAAYLWARGL